MISDRVHNLPFRDALENPSQEILNDVVVKWIGQETFEGLKIMKSGWQVESFNSSFYQQFDLVHHENIHIHPNGADEAEKAESRIFGNP